MATNDTTDRAIRSLTDVAAVEQIAPGMVRVVTWSDCYVVDARGGGCNCPDKQYNEPGTCKHEYAARLFDGDTVDRPTVDDDLSTASQQVATDGGTDRPVDCECMDEYVDDDPLPCFPCVRDGFDVVNPSPPTDEDMVDDEGEIDPVAVADGGRTPAHHDEFLIADPDNEQYDAEDTRAEAEARLDTANEVPGVDAEIFPPGESPDFLWSRMRETYDDGTETPDETPTTEADGGTRVEDTARPDADHEPEVIDADEVPRSPDVGPRGGDGETDLPERNVGDDPLKWLPGEFVDQIDGSPAINRKGFEVLSHFYEVDVSADLQVTPEDTGHEYARVKATAEIDGRTVEAFGSAHVDRGDDSYLLLEMADTRARKRALSIATGAGAVAVSELKNEPEGQ